MHNGSCLCGEITFQVKGNLNQPVACHCTKCRKQTGHYEVSTEVNRSQLKIEGEQNIKWYQSSEKVRRGFCQNCGSSLFFDPIFHDWIAISMGAFEEISGLKIERHIFVANKGDYYDITDGVPQNLQ